MKTILLLAFAVFASASLKNDDKTILGELIDELNATMKTLPEKHKVRFNISIVTIISQNCLYCQILSRA